MNIDSLIIYLDDGGFIANNADKISQRDVRILNSLAKGMATSFYITDRQGQLLIKIIKENLSVFKQAEPDIESIVQLNEWSRPFRKQDTTKKLYIKDSMIQIEFAFSTVIRRKLTEIMSELVNVTQVSTGKHYRAALCEKNIMVLVEKLSKLEFDIDSTLIKYHDIIKTWDVNDYINKYLINTIANDKFKKLITEDLGINTPLNQNLINDRSIRYQYFVDRIKEPTNLTETIANRDTANIWINSNEKTLFDVVGSLVELKRLPIMIVFSTDNIGKLTTELKSVHTALCMHDINNVGIYFRIDNDGSKSEFNQLIAEYNYKKQLDSTTEIVGVQTGKIPKFILKTGWKPMSVISIGHTLKGNKTTAFAKCCDCIITYTETKPLITTWEPN